MDARFLDGLRSTRSNMIREVRGRRLMLVVELHPEEGESAAVTTKLRFCSFLAAHFSVADLALHVRLAVPRCLRIVRFLRKEWLSNDRLWRRVQIAASVFASKT